MMKKQFMRNIQKRTKECQLRFIFIFLISSFFKNIYFLVLFRLSAVCQCFSLLIYHFNKTISELFQPPYVNVRNMRKVNFLNWYQCFFLMVFFSVRFWPSLIIKMAILGFHLTSPKFRLKDCRFFCVSIQSFINLGKTFFLISAKKKSSRVTSP